MDFQVECSSEASLESVAQRVEKLCTEQFFIALHGPLGSGKTTFVKYLGRLWGIEDIKSPSFGLMDVHSGSRTLIHIDAYRLLSGSGWNALALDDLCTSPFCCAVEWPECLPTTLPFQMHLYFSIAENLHHFVRVKTA